MDIFFLKKSEILKSVSIFDSVYKSEKRNIEYQIGRFLTKYVAKNVFNLLDTDIDVLDKKPMFAHSNLRFSISHSDEYVVVAFSQKEIGLDVEKFKERNLEKFSKYFKKEFKTQEEFYKYWTIYEAKYKSKLEKGFEKTFKYKEYYVSTSTLDDENVSFFDVINLSEDSVILENLKLEIKEIKSEEIIFV